jgi:hypothetical protein
MSNFFISIFRPSGAPPCVRIEIDEEVALAARLSFAFGEMSHTTWP